MKSRHPFPVTPENFTQCWQYVDKHYRIARRQSLIAKIGSFLVNLFFLLLIVLMGCGLIHDRFPGSFSQFLETTFFFPIWQKIASALLTPGADLQSDIVKLLSAAYLASFLLFALIAALIWLLYHPFKKKLPEGAYEENTILLAQQAQKCRDYSYKTKLSTSIVATVLTILAAFMLFFAYAVYLNDAQAITELLTKFPFQDVTTNCLLYVMLLYLCSSIISEVLLFITRPIYRCVFSYDLVVQAQRSAFLSHNNADSLTQEELDIQNKEIAVKLREDAIALEKEAAYAKAKSMFQEAAVRGDVIAMEHYARHCLLSRMNDSARYWLKKCVQQEGASRQAKRMLLRMRLGLRHNCRYLQPDEAPPTLGQKIKNIIFTAIKIIWHVFMIGVFIAAILIVAVLFKGSTDPELYANLPPSLVQLLDSFQVLEEFESFIPQETIPVEEVSPFETPTMSISPEGAYWAQNCIAVDTNNEPVIFCYSKDRGSNLYLPLDLGDAGTIYSAGVCTGNIWDIRYTYDAAQYIPQTKTVVIFQAFLATLEAGEYFLILNDSCYAPLLITDTTTFNSPQRGFAGYGNESGWIENDLLNPQDITLSFYNLGDNTIRSLTEVRPLAMVANYPETFMDPQYYTISPDGCSVTIHAQYLQQQQVGSFITFKVRLANGDYLDMGYINIGTVEGDYTGLMELTGPEMYSVSAGGDYVAQYTLNGAPLGLYVNSDSQSGIIEENNLSQLVCDYIDFETGTITIPAELLNALTPGEYIHIGISYSTVHGQIHYVNLAVQITW